MKFLNAVMTMALVMSMGGVYAGIPNDLETSNEGSCFCPVDDTGGKCKGKKYETKSTTPYFGEEYQVEGLERCREFCALEPDTCKGYAWGSGVYDNNSGDNCFLYDSVPKKAIKKSPNGKRDFTDFQCYALSGTDDNTYNLFKPGNYDGGKCKTPINSGTTSCSVNPLLTNCAEGIIAATIAECKLWCTSRGNLCQGFDFDEGKANAGSKSCFERRYKPFEAGAPTSRKDYTDWFCHEKVCNC